ncbi:MAG: mannitol-1-phosphate 5-dehydrogenase [Buchnera aphidicola (Schlechtendalia peitan)]
MKALHFGAGNIGRGFIGETLVRSGFHVIFSDIDEKIVNAINLYHEYDIEIVGHSSYYEKIKEIEAIHIQDPRIISVIAESDIITTSVGVNAIDSLSILIAKGIEYKITSKNNNFVNIMACENHFRCSSRLKKNITNLLSTRYCEYLENNIGFVDTVVDRIIACNNTKKNNILFVRVEHFKELICDASQFKGDIPKIIGMQLSHNLNAYSERKLFTLNTGHAVTAYVGLLHGYTNVYNAILNKNVRDIVYGAMRESGNVLISRYNFDRYEHDLYIKSIISRFENIFVIDDLLRVGRNPIRKLHKNDRLVQPLLGTLEYQYPNVNLVKGIAAALHYNNVHDSEAVQLQYLIKKKGVNYVLLNISELNLESSIITLINKYFYAFKKKLYVKKNS